MNVQGRIINLPKYNMARGAATQTSAPPYTFSGVTIWFLPLRARLDQLRRFCDAYLNIIPPEIAQFRPSLPYVFLQLVHYDRIAMDARNAGWLSQHEIVFSVFLDRYRKIHGKYVYQGSASFSPFIFVDQDSSQMTGREVYGWPKMQGWPVHIDSWPGKSLTPHKITSVGTRVFSEVYTGVPMETATFLEIEKDPDVTLTQIPPNWESPSNPFGACTKAASSMLAWNAHVLDMLMSFPGRGYETQGWPQIPIELLRTMRGFATLKPASGNSINLKQFRDAENPEEVCYQALVNSQISLSRFNQGGMLGDTNLMRGDSTGGYFVRIHKYPNLPIIDSLGIEVGHEEAGDGVPVALMRPDYPFWVDVDLTYSKGENLCWRSKATDGWLVPAQPKGALPKLKKNDTAAYAVEHYGHLYDTARGAAIISLPGPFHLPDTTIRVLPLLAHPGQLQDFVDRRFNHLENQERYQFRAFGKFVYLIVWSTQQAHSRRDDIGHYSGLQVRFSVPVKLFDHMHSDKKPVSAGVISPFVFSDNEITAVTARELYGLPVLRSQIYAPANKWLERGGPDPDKGQGLLKLDAPAMSALFMGQEERHLRLLEIYEGKIVDSVGPPKMETEAKYWGDNCPAPFPKTETEAGYWDKSAVPCPDNAPADAKTPLKNLMALGLETLVNQKCLNEFTLKQFRDAAEPTGACYQCIVRVPQVFERLFSLHKIKEDLHLRIHKIAGQPIVEMLGLRAKLEETSSEGSYYILQAETPFWFRANVRIDTAQNLWTAVVGESPRYPCGE